MQTKQTISAIVASLATLSWFYTLPLFGEDASKGAQKQKIAQADKSSDKIGNCISKFNISKVDLNDPLVKQNLNLLNEYFFCRAANRDDINECSKIPDSDCRGFFKGYQNFYGRLMKNERTTSAILNACSENGGRPQDCANVANALLKKDPSFCSAVDNPKYADMCRAMASGNVPTSKDGAARVLYVNALRSKDKLSCDKIQDTRLKAMCKGILSSDINECSKDEGYMTFAKIYCEAKNKEDHEKK